MNTEKRSAEPSFSMDHGDVRGWCDADVAIVRCVTSRGDPVEMNEAELAGFIAQLEGVYAAIAGDPAEDGEREQGSAPLLPEPISALRGLLDEWCEQRALLPLARVLPAYLANTGLTDGWEQLRSAVRSAAAPPEYQERLRNVERALDDMLDTRR